MSVAPSTRGEAPDVVDPDIARLHRVRATGRARSRVVLLVLAVVLVLVGLLALMLGDRVIAPGDVLATLVGQGGTGDRFAVVTLRLPRSLLAVLVGACFGVAGHIFQTLFANPLASPDIIGISQGASAAAVAALLVFELSGAAVSVAAFVGAVAVAAIITLLAHRRGPAGSRFVLIGIAIAFLVQGVIGYLLTRADVRDAQGALIWLVGSLGTVRLEELIVTGSAALVLTAALVVLAPRLRMLQLGDDTAAGLGVPATASRLLLLLVAVGFAAVATGAAGPIAFVAFVSAPIARRLLGGAGGAAAASALVGAVVVAAADLVAQHAIADLQVPVGIITSVIGAPVLLALVAISQRTSRGTA